MRKLLSTITIAVAALSTCAVLASCGPKEDPEIAVVSVSVSQSSLTLEVGASTSLTATVSPSTATNKTVTWASSNQAVATVNNGTVTAVSPGTVTITATAGGKSETCSVTVNKKMIAVTSVSVDQDKLDMVEDESVTLEATVNPSDADEKTVTWESSDQSIATVDGGKVTAIKEGMATITAKAGSKTATCKVTVSKKYIEVESVELDKKAITLEEGQSETLVATVSPADATAPAVTWESDNPEVATVEDGVVTAIKEGTAVITAKAGGEIETCAVTVTKPEYYAPYLESVDVTAKYFAWDEDKGVFADVPWFNSILRAKKQFIYPHILVSYITSEWYKLDNLVYIIAGETPEKASCEHIGGYDNYLAHADGGYLNIIQMTPTASVMAGVQWSHLEEYIKKNPDYSYMVSCAVDRLGSDFHDVFVELDEYKSLKRILSLSNVVISVASTNNSVIGEPLYWKIYNESENKSGDKFSVDYNSTSVNSEIDNKYCVTGYNPSKPNIFGIGGDIESNMPVGFGRGNLVVPFTSTNKGNSSPGDDTTSSFATASFSGTLGNFLSILMKNNPGITLERASSIMREKYFRAEKMLYKDGDGNLKEGGDWHFFKTDDFIANEILHNETVDSAFSSASEEINLPSVGGLCYFGPGVLFEVSGVVYEMTDANRDVLVSAVSEGKEIKWTFSRAVAKKYVSGSAEISIRVMDHDACLIPDVTRDISVAL